MKNLSIVRSASRHFDYPSATIMQALTRAIALSSVSCLLLLLLAGNVWALTSTQEKQLIKRCDKINAKIKKSKIASRAGGSAAKMEKFRLKIYALDDEYSAHKCILVRSKLKML
ncbi:MAG: hypothetical protein OFPI_43730 [Osedax symbiont Rs2]|nr:MAG: hypothetical protein OFPI_43730 [Osedax symbiont Rs2]